MDLVLVRHCLSHRYFYIAVGVLTKTIYLCFVDCGQILDTVQHEMLINSLNTVDLNGRDISIIANLYWNQTESVGADGGAYYEICPTRMCIILLLLNLYAEKKNL